MIIPDRAIPALSIQLLTLIPFEIFIPSDPKSCIFSLQLHPSQPVLRSLMDYLGPLYDQYDQVQDNEVSSCPSQG